MLERKTPDDLARVARLLESGQPFSEDDLAQEAPGVDADTRRRLVSVGNRLARLVHRERELSGLIASATDLMRPSGEQEVLQRLVDRAHELVDVDVAYLSEYDARTTELSVRAARGSISAKLVGLRVPVGIGLASRVARLGAPQALFDYDTEPGLPREATVDEAVHAEGLRSLLGVPVVAADELLGVLFVGQRTRRRFRSADISLLMAFAGHGAMALHSSRLMSDLQSALAEAQTARAAIADRLAATNRAAQIHQDLTAHLLADGGITAVAATLTGRLGFPVEILDARLGGSTTADLAAAFEESRRSGRAVTTAGPRPRTVVAAMAGSRCLGAVVASPPDGGLDAVDRRTLERAAHLVALVTMREQAAVEAEHRTSSDLVAAMLEEGAPDSSLARSEALGGPDLRGPLVLTLIDGGDRERLLARVRRFPRTLAAPHRHGIALISAGDDNDAGVVIDAVRGLGLDDANALVAAVAGVADLPVAADELRASLELMAGLGVQGRVARGEEYAPYAHLFGDGEGTRAYVLRLLGPVLDWDAGHDTDLSATLATFVDSNCSITRTAEALFVHANTVRQRLARLDQLLGADWQEPERLFRLRVAARALRLLP